MNTPRLLAASVAGLLLSVIPIAASSQDASSSGLIVYSTYFRAGDRSALCLTDPQGARTALLRMFDGGGVTSPTWSPDSSRIAFTRNSELVVMGADGSNEVVVTRGAHPSWSPDGEQIAFEREGDVYVIDADGTDEHTLGAGRNPDWSPDGQRIALDRVPDPVITDGPEGELETMDAEGGGVEEHGYGQQPAWSPDGTEIAFAIHSYWGSDLYVKSAEGTSRRNLTDSGNADYRARPSSPAWSPDGGQIVYPADGLWVVNADGTEGHRILDGGEAADWGPAPASGEDPLAARPCEAPRRSVTMRLHGHLYARGRLWTNDPERCPLNGISVSVWRREGSRSFRLAGTTSTDADGRYEMELELRTRNGFRRDRPGAYQAWIHGRDSSDCSVRKSGVKFHRH